MKWPCELHQGRQRGLALSALKHADEVPLNAGFKAKLFLRQAGLLAQPAQDLSERDRKVQYSLQLSLEKLGR